MQPSGIFTSRIRAGALRSLPLVLVVLGAATPSASAALIDFSDLTLAPDSFYNGGPVTNSSGWASGGATFGNSYNASFGGFWSGFAYSNVNDSSTPGFGNQYAAYAGSGAGGSGIYAVAYAGAQTFINLPASTFAQSVLLTNTTYTAFDLLSGSGFSKKFGGASGNDPDFLDVVITGYDGQNGAGAITGAVTFRLADFTFADKAQDYIVDEWTLVDLGPVGSAASLRFTWASSDVGAFGINTPTYVALDNLALVPEPASASVLAGLGVLAMGGLRRRRVV